MRRLAPLSLLLAVATALPSFANGGYAGGGEYEVDVYFAEVAIPGGEAFVELDVVSYRGASVEADPVPNAGPEIGQEAYACIHVFRNKQKDFGCTEVDLSSASRQTDLSSGTFKVTVPSRTGKGSITADVTLTAIEELEAEPDYVVFSSYGPIAFADAQLGARTGRVVEASGTVTSTRIGGGKVGSTMDGWLGREYWIGSMTFLY